MTTIKPGLNWPVMNQKDINPNSFGGRVRECREELGWSQEELADALGVSDAAVSQWETNAITPRSKRMEDIAALFGVSLNWLIQGISPKKNMAVRGGAMDGRGNAPNPSPPFRGSRTAIPKSPTKPRRSIKGRKRRRAA